MTHTQNDANNPHSTLESGSFMPQYEVEPIPYYPFQPNDYFYFNGNATEYGYPSQLQYQQPDCNPVWESPYNMLEQEPYLRDTSNTNEVADLKLLVANITNFEEIS
jgi:hypothetical protein